MRKILTVIGARPQFIKASVVSEAIGKSGSFKEVVVHTGQHFDANMSQIFFAELGMRQPDYHLKIHGGTHGAMTGLMLADIERVLLIERPDCVLVYGDTNSTLAGALAAVKLHIPVAHVEAGLRSFNMRMPEEINRILTDRISSWLFAPTVTAMQHLLAEGISAAKTHLVGDVMYDVALHYGALASMEPGILKALDLTAGGFILATVHRAENTDNLQRLTVIADALQVTAREMRVVWPLHPRTRMALRETGRLDDLAERVCLIDPVGYLDMVRLEKHAALVVTDSGGVQKEAFFHGVPCVTLRDETEWVELVESGWNRLAPPVDVQSLTEKIWAALGSRGSPVSPYGNGTATQAIVAQLGAPNE